MDVNTSKKIGIIVNCILLLMVSLGLYFGIYEKSGTFWNYDDNVRIIQGISILGLYVAYFIYMSHYKISGKKMSPYIIFIFFVYMFNFGQCILWAFGIHLNSEIGKATHIILLNQNTILKTQIISIIGITFIHFGAILSFTLNKAKVNVNERFSDLNVYRIIGTFGLLVTYPAVIYRSIKFLIVAKTLGYSEIYYGGVIDQGGVLLYLDMLFFPTIMCYLIGSDFSKKSWKNVGLLFGSYLMINLLSGDRGSWIYSLLILVWLYTKESKKVFTLSEKIKLYTVGLTALPLIQFFVSIRENVVSHAEKTSFSDELINLYSRPIIEMGQSMRVLGITLLYDMHKNWHLGNTHLAGILGMFLPRMRVWFGFPDMYLENWFSQDFLHLKGYGMGFSIIAEAYVNYGDLFMFPALFVFGMFFGYMLFVPVMKSKNYFRLFYASTTCVAFAGYSRGALTYHIRIWFWGTVLIILLISLLHNLKAKPKGKPSIEL